MNIESGMNKPAPVTAYHPPLFALIPALGLYAQNAGKVPFSAALRASVVLVIGACITWALLVVILQNRRKGAMAASVLIFAALPGWTLLEYGIESLTPSLSERGGAFWMAAYGVIVLAAFAVLIAMHRNMKAITFVKLLMVGGAGAVAGFICTRNVFIPVFGDVAAWLIAMYLIAVATVFVLVLWRRTGFRKATRTINWFAGILVLLFLANGLYQYPWGAHRSPAPLDFETASAPESAATELPDIYLLVLRGYARADVLRTQYHYNNGPFLDSLREMGFDVAEKSLSNYPNSMLSWASCLNMDYLDSMVSAPEAATADIGDVAELCHNNRVYAFLKQKGYTLMAFSPGMAMLEPGSTVDVCLSPFFALSEFDMVLLNSIAPGRVIRAIYHYGYGSAAYWPHAFLRKRAQFTFDKLASVAAEKTPGPKFVFVQTTMPGPPFLFDRDGNWTEPYTGTSRILSETFFGTPIEFREQYRGQLHYTNTLVENALKHIIAESPRPAVILLISDHGPLLQFDPAQLSPLALQEQFGTLVAARFPKDPASPETPLDDSLSLVNLFRVTFKEVFGADLALLPNQTFMPSLDKPFEATPVQVQP